jgi:hypothetical protein
VPGRAIVVVDGWVTGVFLVASAAAAAVSALGTPVAVLDIALFVAGCGIFLLAYAVAVARSRVDQLSLSGVFFLTGSAPREVAWRLRLALGLQIAGALVAALLRPEPLAFGVLVPVFGLAMVGLWGARHGAFPPRDVASAETHRPQ